MKIESVYTNITSLPKTNISQGQPFEKGQLLSGKIMSMNGEALDIVLSSGAHIKAVSKGSVNLPLNINIEFEVIENTSNILYLKPAPSSQEASPGRDRMLFSLARELGIKPSQDNINFLDSNSRTLSKNMALLSDMLLEGENTQILQKLQEILVSPEKLSQYLKGFNDESMVELVNRLEELFARIKMSSLSSNEYSRILGDILKSFSVQVNHEFPLFFIPVPLIFNNKFYPGEIWIDKDSSKTNTDDEQLSVFVILDTPLFGRVESILKTNGRDISADLFCKKEILPVFSDNLGILKDRLSSAGVAVKSLGVHELKRNTGFADLAQKYVHPLPSVDVKI